MGCSSTLPGAAARSAPRRHSGPNCVAPHQLSLARGRRQRASSDAHQNLKAASNSIFCRGRHPEPSVRGRRSGCRAWSQAPLVLELASVRH